jgi:release factor glutamine methyltransferase
MHSNLERPMPGRQRTIGAALSEGSRFLCDRHIDGARLDAEALLRHVLKMEPADFYMAIDAPLNRLAEERFWELLGRRGRREPLAYITGKKEFWSLDFAVTPDVLIPRPETEHLVEIALEQASRCRRKAPLKILEIGTGSGAIAVCLARELSEAQITALDISPAALNIARGNARRHGVAARIAFMQRDLFPPRDGQEDGFDLVISNPPYVRHGDLAQLAPEIRDWEPMIALDGGADGLNLYRRIAAAARDHLSAGGFLALEIGEDMAGAVVGLLAAAGAYEPAAVHRDYAGKNRVIATRTDEARG